MIDVEVRSRIPPPLPSLVALIIGFVSDWLWPWQVAYYEQVLPFGILFLGLMVILMAMTSSAFKRHGTSSNPYKESTNIVNSGPFRFSRNPIYVSVMILQVALGLLFNNMWILLLVIPVFIIIHYLVVIREESYLEAKFGDEYLHYKSEVRRWI